ncbi:hypothetical protein CEXT_288371 [Caerostris extrusa]|uniref:Uncharacterized protein n=1 Tax=Caerostris extrusa TaxID=172846 RepID=A0AAV4MPU6_CAEEX|nr:hypothetical protein CEXT_288371 [Caerostris extrusa]
MSIPCRRCHPFSHLQGQGIDNSSELHPASNVLCSRIDTERIGILLTKTFHFGVPVDVPHPSSTLINLRNNKEKLPIKWRVDEPTL